MKEDKTAFGLSPEKLVEFMRLGEGEEQSQPKKAINEDKTRLLGDRLRAPLPFGYRGADRVSALAKQLYEETLILAGRTIGDLIMNPETDPVVLGDVKDYAKYQSEIADSEAEKETAIVVYYHAIASALVYHDQKITTYSYRELDKFFSLMMSKKWILPKIHNMFNKAQRICRQKADDLKDGMRND